MIDGNGLGAGPIQRAAKNVADAPGRSFVKLCASAAQDQFPFRT
jgi:hypothetical protein